MLKNVFLGFIIGIGKIIPGVSGSMLAITFGIYEKIIESIINPIKNIRFILSVLPGFILAIIIGSKIITFLLDNYFFLTMMFFIGLISGSLPKIISKVHNFVSYKTLIVIFISLLIPLSLTWMDNNISDSRELSYSFLIIIGFIEASTTIIPGISGTAVLMIIGYYDKIMNFYSNILNIKSIPSTIKFAIPYFIGIIIGIYVISKLVNYMTKKHENIFYSIIVGLAISSIIIMLKNSYIESISLITFIKSILLITIGYIISNKFDK